MRLARVETRVAAGAFGMRCLQLAQRHPAIHAYEQPKAAAGGGTVHLRLRSAHCHNCSGEVMLVRADRQSMSMPHDQRETPGTMCAKFASRTSAARAPSMKTSMKLQGRNRVSRRNAAF